jgi:N-acetylneuraminic acid mutarotase
MLRFSPTSLRLGLVLLALAACDRAATEPDARRPVNAPTLGVAANSWLTRAEMPRLRSSFALAAVPNSAGQWIVYVMTGGSNITQAYNVSTNRWSNKALFPQQIHSTNGAAVIGGKIYVAGGIGVRRVAQSTLYRYTPATNTWAAISGMPSQGYRGVTGVINNQLYILTGCFAGADCDFGFDEALAFYRYNPATNQWATLADPPSEHEDGMAGVIGGKFYVAGGADGLNQLDVYNPATNSWTTKASMPKGQFATSGRWDGAGVALGGKLYVIGGWQSDQNGQVIQTRSNFVYNPATNVWTAKAILPSPQADVRGSLVKLGTEARIEVMGGDRPATNVQYVP